MMLETDRIAREQVLDELVALATAEAKSGDGRALRIMTRYREAVSQPKVRDLHQDDGA